MSGDERDGAGKTLVSWAVSYGYEHIVRYLVEQAEVDVNIQDKEGNTTLHIVVRKEYGPVYRSRARRIIQYLIEQANADVNIQNNNGDDVLALADGWKKDFIATCLENKRLGIRSVLSEHCGLAR